MLTRLNSVRTLAALSVATIALLPSTASAQGTDDSKNADNSSKNEIIVTGTLIRGTMAVGSQTLNVDSQAILDKGVNSTNEVLSLIPQVSNTFNGRFDVDPRGAASGVSINRPNLRNLPAINSSSGGTTLVLMDGFRMTPVGVNQSAIDVDIIPPAVIEGVDVMTDGGSSLYGADAVAGVINFRTKKSFDGVKIDANYGFGTTIKAFDQWDGAITAGTHWNSGNAYISVGHSHRDAVLNAQTDWASGKIYDANGNASYAGTQCASPVGTFYRYVYIPSFHVWTDDSRAGGGLHALGTPCDQTSAATYLPKQTRTNVFASLSQKVADNIDLRVTAYWTKRDTTVYNFPRGYTSAGQPLVAPTQAPGAGGPASPYDIPNGYGFTFAPNSAYENTPSRVGFNTWGVTPELKIDLGGGWLLRNTLHFGRSFNYQYFPDVNAALAQSYINSGALNPLNVAAASPSVISDILDYENAQQTIQQLFDFRAVADGPLFALAGGDAKLAVGVEYQDPSVKIRLGSDRFGAINSQPYRHAERNAKSVFAELTLPLTSWVDVAGSVRHDEYSDFGSTTNPTIGVRVRPAGWFEVFGHWNTSFNAPTPIDTLAISTGRYACGIYGLGHGPYDPLNKWNGAGTCAFIVDGGSPGLKPQKAISWAVGFDAKPVAGLQFGGEFYSIKFKDVLGAVNPSDLSTYVTRPDLYVYNPSAQYWKDLLATLANGDALAAQHSNTDVALLVDRRITNISLARLQGIDFHAFYNTDTSLGHLSIGISGTKQTKSTLYTGSVVSDRKGSGTPEFVATTFVALQKGRVSGRVTVNYSGRYHDSGVDYLNNVVSVDPFVVTNLFLGYDFGDSDGPFAGTSFRLTVDNIFEEKPQTIMRSTSDVLSYANWTLGRVIKLGVSKKF